MPVGLPGVRAIGSWDVESSVDTGPILGTVKKNVAINIPDED